MHKRILGLAAVALLALPTVANAAPNRMTQLPGVGANYDWDSGMLNGAAATGQISDTTGCTPGAAECDDTLLYIGEQSKLTITMSNPSAGAVDFDLYLYNSDASGAQGTTLGSSATSSAAETLTHAIDAPGYYLVRVRAATAIGGTYHGNAKLAASDTPVGFPPSPIAEPVPATPPPAAPASGPTGTTTTGTTTTGTTTAGTTTTTTGSTGTTGTSAKPANQAPKSYVAKPQKTKSGYKVIRGTTSDDGKVKAVRVALVRQTGKRCVGLRRSGGFTAMRSCSVPAYLPAKGTTTWSLTLRHRLAKGRYVVYAKATDTAGKRQAKVTRYRFVVR